jgi:hypothetical protein
LKPSGGVPRRAVWAKAGVASRSAAAIRKRMGVSFPQTQIRLPLLAKQGKGEVVSASEGDQREPSGS